MWSMASTTLHMLSCIRSGKLTRPTFVFSFSPFTLGLMHDLPEWPKSPNDGQKANAPLEVPRPTHELPERVVGASEDGSHLQGE